MLVSLTVGKVDAGVTVLLTPDKRLIEFPSILLPPDISSGSIVDITVAQNVAKETDEEQKFRALQDCIFQSFGAAEPAAPALRCRNATQTSVVLEWDPVALATADLISLSLYRNGQKAGNIPRPLHMHSTKISGLAVDTEYTFHLVLRTSAGTRMSEKVAVKTHKMTDLSGITVTTGILPAAVRAKLTQAVERIGAKIVDGVRIDTTHFVTTEGRGVAWEKAVENNIPVVRPEWVAACEKSGRILGVTKFYLDAMRPGPPTEAPAAPAVPPKDEPPREPPPPLEPEDGNTSGAGAGAGARAGPEAEPMAGAGRAGDNALDEGDAEAEAAAAARGAESASPPANGREAHAMALRPREDESAAAASSTEAEAEDEDEARHGKQGAKEAEGKPSPLPTPDAASFQEVEL